MVLLLAFAFVSGFVTILAPCIWPILPIVFSSAATGKGHHKPLGITLGILLTFGFFTLSVSYLVHLFHFDPNILRNVAVVVIALLGISLLFPSFSTILEGVVSRISSLFGVQGKRNNDFSGGLITGMSLGIVWSPCAGPILASIAALASTGKVSTEVILITSVYLLGVGIPLFIFAFASQWIAMRTKAIASHTQTFQQIFGVIMILTAFAIYTHYDIYLQSQLLNAFPQFNLTSIENNSALTQQLNILKGTTTANPTSSDVFNANQPAPDFTGITHWLNTSKPLALSNLKGKVVLVDFWTYTCINCIRTLPHVTSWYDKYHKDGFVVIGVHTPEFAFEHDTTNVQNAIKMYNIHYPVAQDNNYDTWNAYNNQYWPAEYLIDATGTIRRVEFGEGNYQQTEEAIQQLLKETGKNVSAQLDTMPNTAPTEQISPESYLGTNRMQYFYPGGSTGDGEQAFTMPQSLPQDAFSFGGDWNISPENATAGKNAALSYHFFANKVFLVIRPGSNLHPTIKIYLDNKLVDMSYAGADVKDGTLTVDTDRLYNLIDLKGHIGNHTLRLEFQNSGIQVFAFTFG